MNVAGFLGSSKVAKLSIILLVNNSRTFETFNYVL